MSADDHFQLDTWPKRQGKLYICECRDKGCFNLQILAVVSVISAYVSSNYVLPYGDGKNSSSHKFHRWACLIGKLNVLDMYNNFQIRNLSLSLTKLYTKTKAIFTEYIHKYNRSCTHTKIKIIPYRAKISYYFAGYYSGMLLILILYCHTMSRP